MFFIILKINRRYQKFFYFFLEISKNIQNIKKCRHCSKMSDIFQIFSKRSKLNENVKHILKYVNIIRKCQVIFKYCSKRPSILGRFRKSQAFLIIFLKISKNFQNRLQIWNIFENDNFIDFLKMLKSTENIKYFSKLPENVKKKSKPPKI